MVQETVYCGILKQHIQTRRAIEFSVVKVYPEINQLRYFLIRIYNAGTRFVLVRELCLNESRSLFKTSTVIECGTQFFVMIREFVDEQAAERTVQDLQSCGI